MPNQPRAANMHIANGRRHLLECAHFFDHELVRQKPLIDQLHHVRVFQLQPNRSEMLTAYLHIF